jgi:hypothetical protein
MARAEVAPEPRKKQFVKYNTPHDFMEREISEADWKQLGAESASDTKWNTGNKYRVAREDIPLNDEQLTAFLATDAGLDLVEE